jgi:hypothetical protein
VSDQLFLGLEEFVPREVKGFDVGGEGGAAGSDGGLEGGGLEEIDLEGGLCHFGACHLLGGIFCVLGR